LFAWGSMLHRAFAVHTLVQQVCANISCSYLVVMKVCLKGHIYLSSLLVFWRIFVELAKSKQVENLVEEKVRLQSIGF
jgi:hypothetical protein